MKINRSINFCFLQRVRTGKKLGKIDLKKLEKLGPKNGLNIKLMMTIGNMVAFVKTTVKSTYQF